MWLKSINLVFFLFFFLSSPVFIFFTCIETAIIFFFSSLMSMWSRQLYLAVIFECNTEHFTVWFYMTLLLLDWSVFSYFIFFVSHPLFFFHFILFYLFYYYYYYYYYYYIYIFFLHLKLNSTLPVLPKMNSIIFIHIYKAMRSNVLDKEGQWRKVYE